MTAPNLSEFDQSVSSDDVIRELEVQLGMAAGQLTRMRLLLARRDEQVRYLKEQLAARDTAETRD
jgi:hypothetical protein